jgi:hypothetical protein
MNADPLPSLAIPRKCQQYVQVHAVGKISRPSTLSSALEIDLLEKFHSFGSPYGRAVLFSMKPLTRQALTAYCFHFAHIAGSANNLMNTPPTTLRA